MGRPAMELAASSRLRLWLLLLLLTPLQGRQESGGLRRAGPAVGAREGQEVRPAPPAPRAAGAGRMLRPLSAALQSGLGPRGEWDVRGPP